MATIQDIFGRISTIEEEKILDDSGYITREGYQTLERIGVVVGKNVIIAPSTIHELITSYNCRKTPKPSMDKLTELIMRGGVKLTEEDSMFLDYIERMTKGNKKLTINIGNGSSIGDNVRLGRGIRIGRNSTISENCEIGDGSNLGEGVYLGRCVFVGIDSDVGDYARLNDKVTLAPRNVVHPRTHLLEGATVYKNNKYPNIRRNPR